MASMISCLYSLSILVAKLLKELLRPAWIATPPAAVRNDIFLSYGRISEMAQQRQGVMLCFRACHSSKPDMMLSNSRPP